MEVQPVVSSSETHTRRERSRPKKPATRVRGSAESVFKRMDEQDLKIDAQGRAIDTVQRDMGTQTLVMQRIEKTLASMHENISGIAALVGMEEEDGNGGYKGTGIMGRIRRVEKSQETLMSKYKTWLAWGAGFTTAMAAMLAALWWLIGDKLEVILKGTAQ